MEILDGKLLSQKIINDLSRQDLHLFSLHIIWVGDDPSSQKYVTLKEQKCQEIGLKCVIHHFPSSVPTPQIIELIKNLNDDPSVTGFFVQLPLPSNFNKNKILSNIDPKKDVDGLLPNSKFMPAVVRGVIHLLDEYKLSFAGKNAVIINDSNLIGIPLKKILERRKVNVTMLNHSSQNIAKTSRGADVVFSATGVKGLISAEYIKPGAVVVDIGGGDINFTEVSGITSYITPTFGGVGPMTIASLLQNLVENGKMLK